MASSKNVFLFDLNESYEGEDEILFFNGVGTKNGLLIGEYESLNLDDILNREIDGQWYAVVRINNTIRVITDYFGFSVIFYSFNNNNLVISESFFSVLSYLKKNNIETCLNYSEIYPYFASNNVILSQAYSVNTPCLQIKRLPPTEFFEVKNNSFKLGEYQVIEPSGTYEELLEIAIKKALSNLSNLKKMGFNTIEQSLSGGKDSRCVLSLALKAGLKNRLTIRTQPKFEDGGKVKSKIIDDDFDIALDLVSSLKLSWSQPKNSIAKVISFNESLNDYKNYRGANYFNWNFTKYNIRLLVTERYIELAGGVGDAFRSPWGNYLKRLKRGGLIESVQNDVEKASNITFDLLVKKTDRLSDLFDNSKKLFTTEILKMGGDGFFDAMDINYYQNRNRYHFGNHKNSFEVGVLLYYPLALKEFIYASRKLSYDERSQGKMNFDIINYLDSSLHSFGYETPFPFNVDCQREIPKDLNNEALYKDKYLETLSLRSEMSKKIYSLKSYNVKTELDKSLRLVLDNCLRDSKINLILSELGWLDRIPDLTNSEKVRLHNKLEIISAVLSDSKSSVCLSVVQ